MILALLATVALLAVALPIVHFLGWATGSLVDRIAPFGVPAAFGAGLLFWALILGLIFHLKGN